jgi:DNA repair exonuclease SbcCD ATPase subunit
MISIQKLTVRNFMSVGNVTQAVNFDRKDLTLVLGENLDLGGDGSRNGTGKTSLINALSYALYGNALSNIRKDNLVNRTNGKHMMVSVDFSVAGVQYKIERGRKPNVLKFYVNNQVLGNDKDEAQGDSRETQEAIERVLNMSHDMFKHVLALNTYTEPFLSLKSNDQRTIIEQLLGITLLSEKAERVKEQARNTRDAIQNEESRIRAVQEANKRIEEQISALKMRQSLWQKKHQADMLALANQYNDLQQIDITAELAAHQLLSQWSAQKERHDAYVALAARQTAWKQKHDRELQALTQQLEQLSHIDFDAEIGAHQALAIWNQQQAQQAALQAAMAADVKTVERERKLIAKLTDEINTLQQHRCYACGQDFHDQQHTQVLTNKQQMLSESQAHVDSLLANIQTQSMAVCDLGPAPSTFYNTEAEAVRQSAEVNNVLQQIAQKNAETDPYQEQLAEAMCENPGAAPATHYDTERAAVEHRSRVESLLQQIENKDKETDPYCEQIDEMTHRALQPLMYDHLNELTRVQEHQDFLLKLLTSKDSFVRKKIIDQNLSYLNQRLTHYLDRMGLPHTVKFMNDLSVMIEELGRELDFDNLSRGERTRLILSMSWAFRDVWESLYQPINLMFIDELMDNGLDTQGVENGLSLLKKLSRERNKSVWLVSHRDELAGRVEHILRVVKSNGFTEYSTDVEKT